MATNKKPADKAQTETTVEEVKKPAAQVKRGPTVAKRGAKKEALEEVDPEVKIESALGRTEQFFYKNGKSLLTALAIIVVIIGGFFAYKYLWLEHRAEKAGEAMFVAEQMFMADSFDVALNGDGNNDGFLQVIDNYGSTTRGNIAKHYAGVCYMHLGDMDRALEYLSKYKASKGSPNTAINAQNIGLQGDIYIQKGEYGTAADKFLKASQINNDVTTPYYLKKLGLAYAKQGKNAEAVAAYQRIADEFPTSMEARDIAKFIGQQEQK